MNGQEVVDRSVGCHHHRICSDRLPTPRFDAGRFSSFDLRGMRLCSTFLLRFSTYCPIFLLYPSFYRCREQVGLRRTCCSEGTFPRFMIFVEFLFSALSWGLCFSFSFSFSSTHGTCSFTRTCTFKLFLGLLNKKRKKKITHNEVNSFCSSASSFNEE